MTNLLHRKLVKDIPNASPMSAFFRVKDDEQRASLYHVPVQPLKVRYFLYMEGGKILDIGNRDDVCRFIAACYGLAYFNPSLGDTLSDLSIEAHQEAESKAIEIATAKPKKVELDSLIEYQMEYEASIDYLGFRDTDNQLRPALAFYSPKTHGVVYLPSTGSGLTELLTCSLQRESWTGLPILPEDMYQELLKQYHISLKEADDFDLTAYWYSKFAERQTYVDGEKLSREGYYHLFKQLTMSAGLLFHEVVQDHHRIVSDYREGTANRVLDDMKYEYVPTMTEYEPEIAAQHMDKVAGEAIFEHDTAELAKTYVSVTGERIFIYRME